MDNTDWEILACLSENARIRASAISQRIGLSVSAVIERIRKMEAGGVIRGYTVLLDRRQLGKDVAAFIEVCLEHPKHCDAFTRAVLAEKSVVACDYLTGEFDYILKIVTESSESLEQIHRRIKGLPGVSATKTHVVLKSVKDNGESMEAEGRT